jgi:hypothetical protein
LQGIERQHPGIAPFFAVTQRAALKEISRLFSYI